jgi:hypothetical protein
MGLVNCPPCPVRCSPEAPFAAEYPAQAAVTVARRSSTTSQICASRDLSADLP